MNRGFSISIFSAIWMSITSITLSAQAPDTLWTKMYGGIDSDVGFSVIETHKRYYVMTGHTASYGAGDYDVYVIMTNANGDTIWTRAYGEEFSDVSYSIVETSDYGFAIAGVTKSYGADNQYEKRLLMKTDFNGTIQWTRAYGDSASRGRFYSLSETADNGFILVGREFVSEEQQYDVNLSKVDSSGILLWSRTFGGPGYDEGWSVLQTPDGGYVFVGQWERSLFGTDDLFVIKTNYLGYPIWTRIIQGENSIRGRSIKRTSDGGLIVAGLIFIEYNPPIFDWDFYLTRLSSSGDVLWSNTFGGEKIDWSFGVTEAADGGFLVTGQTFSYVPVSSDVWVVKTDPTGEMEWKKNIGGRSDETGRDVILTSDGYFLIVGKTLSYGEGIYDVYLIKLNSGQTRIFDSTVTEPAKNHIISQNYPNPFNASTVLNFAVAHSGNVKLNVYNLVGQYIETIIDGRYEAGEYAVSWDASSHSSGIYFYRIQAGDYTDTRKMLLIK